MVTDASFQKVYSGRTVLVTGHTGFKGSWLAAWLTALGAKVVGYSAYLPSAPNHFSVGHWERQVQHFTGDVRDLVALKKVFSKYRPSVVFHLAAQPIVSQSFADPATTFATNVLGTMNILESIRHSKSVAAAVMITSDKCYRNQEWDWGYRENDELGGDDPYSASKACAEMVCRSYARSFFFDGKVRIGTVRAGNVIGGGDWARDRIVPDCVRAWSRGKTVVVRSPASTRPWQHVLEPLSGYLWYGARLLSSKELHGEAFNFGPDGNVTQPVSELIEKFSEYFGGGAWKFQKSRSRMKESKLLRLSCDKALKLLGWRAVLDFEETLKMTAAWYAEFYSAKNKDMRSVTMGQIADYVSRAANEGLSWTK